MLQDPPLNFAISTRGSAPGIDLLGIQSGDAAELSALSARTHAAKLAVLDEGATTCCYASGQKNWITGPQGVAWWHFDALGNVPVFKEAPATAAGKPVGLPVTAAKICC